MTFEEIIKLLDAGFTREEILNLGNLTPAEPDPGPVPEPEPEVPTTPVETIPAVQPTVSPEMVYIQQELARLTHALQGNALMMSQQPPEMSSEDILASIINPVTGE